MKLQFWGATDDVTGSMTFLHLPQGTLLVDCGLAQGTEKTQAINLLPLPLGASHIKAVIITHAHLDHSGYLPRLVRKGFRGKIYCTPATAKLMRIILLDSAKLNEDDFYGEKDVQETLKLVQTREWNATFEELGVQLTFFPAGHILGASSVRIKTPERSFIFSGDLGRYDDPIFPEHPRCQKADVIIMESTYGGKRRSGSLEKDLHSFLATVSRESRVGIIASFAVARAQMLLTLISEFFERHPEDKVRVFVDSPMMAEANKVYRHYSHLTKHPESVYSALENFDLIEFPRQWEGLSRKQGPLVILSSSGMLTGGRIHRHLYNWRDDKRAILFLPGYQGEGTPGRLLAEGKRELVGPRDEVFTWKGEVWLSEQFSSHADQEDLLRWVGENDKQSHIFLLHGESAAKSALKIKLAENGFTSINIPTRGEVFEL